MSTCALSKALPPSSSERKEARYLAIVSEEVSSCCSPSTVTSKAGRVEEGLARGLFCLKLAKVVVSSVSCTPARSATMTHRSAYGLQGPVV